MNRSAEGNFVSCIASRPGKIAPLDGLRAFAIILVLFRHGATSFSSKLSEPATEFVPTWMFNGWAGVDLFFVLSGFLIGYHLMSTWQKGEKNRISYLGQYWLKRILRTFPLYYAILIIVSLNLIPLYSHSTHNLGSEVFNHIFFLQDYYGTKLLTPLWSLATEEKFYLICPFLIWLIIRVSAYSKLSAIGIILAMSITPLLLRLKSLGVYTPVDYSSFFWTTRAPFHMALDGLFMGVLVSYVYFMGVFGQKQSKHFNYLFLCIVIILSTLMSSASWMSEDANWKSTSIILYVFPVLFAGLIYCSVHTSGEVRRILSSTGLRFISKLSYSLYLVHMLIVPLSLFLFESLGGFNLPSALSFTLYILLYLFFSVCLSLVLHLIIEKPFLKIKSRVSYGA